MSCNDQKDLLCSPYQLTKTASLDNNLVDAVMNESLSIGGADINVFKLLGVHEKGSLVDLAKNGSAISGGSGNTYDAGNAFTAYCNEWRSSQRGAAVVASAFIGYDFGYIKLENGRARYGVDTSVKHNIATISIKQGTASKNRVTKARIERSSDGLKWYGVAVVTFPDDDHLNTVTFKASVQERYWRIRPVVFNGGPNDYWVVQAIQLMDYNATAINNIEDPIFQENRNRDYAPETVPVKGYYDLVDAHSELTKYGIELPTQSYTIRLNFTACVQQLGRPFVIGDIIQLPSETQYSATLEPVYKYVEVTDVSWSTEGYTPGWVPNTLQVIAQPMLATQETQDIFGGLVPTVDEMGLSDKFDGNNPVYQDLAPFTQAIKEAETVKVPERGREGQATVRQITDADIAKAQQLNVPVENLQRITLRSHDMYAEDAMPPNGAEFTEGPNFPTSPIPVDGDYHRLTYVGTAEGIPTRLYRWSGAKNRWIYLESDRRAEYKETRPLLQDFLKTTGSEQTVEPQNIDQKKVPVSGEGTLETD